MHTEHLLGYKKSSNGKILIDKEQAKIVKLIYKLFLEGMNNYQLQQYLEGKEILSPMGTKKWQYNVINSILTNNNPRLARRGFSHQPTRLITGDPDFRVFYWAQLPLSLLLTLKRVFILLQTSFVCQLVFQFLILNIILNYFFV